MTGTQTLAAFAVLFFAFIVVDVYAYFTGQTLTQLLIEQKNKHAWFRLALFAIILVAALFLIFHFELLG